MIFLLFCAIGSWVVGATAVSLALHWRRAARDARARLADERIEAHAEQARIIAALIHRYGHDAALTALDAAARRGSV